MSEKKVYRAIGLMSGTSLDGVDVALLETDGYDHVKPLGFESFPYTAQEREIIRKAFGKTSRKDEAVQEAEAIVTRAHIAAVQKAGWEAHLIGFHGQTIFHAPQDGVTIQIGDGAAMAKKLGVKVVDDFRKADVMAGGQGAPFAPLYHAALARAHNVKLPAAFLNIGGVANVTWIGPEAENILAFDTGPGNALMDDWALARTGQSYDQDGALAADGQVLDAALNDWLKHPYFAKKPPKSLDRNEWDIADFGRIVRDMEQISDADGAATLLAFTVEAIKKAQDFMKQAPKAWYVCGGGRHNAALMGALAGVLPVQPIEALGLNGDATEAECFAYLAVRSKLGEPLSLPSTTGVPLAQTGGVLHKPVP